MKSLVDIEADFTTAVEMHEPQRTRRLLDLMNELERDYGTFIINPTAADMERPDVQLYRKISIARNL